MPNWCENRLVVKGSRAEEVVRDLEEYGFEAVAPMPKEFSDAPCFMIDEKELAKKVFDGEVDMDLVSDRVKKAVDLYKKYGAFDWCDWSIENWGCKWNVDEVIRTGCLFDGHAECSFDTPWSPPLAWAKKASKHYDARLILTYEEPGVFFFGQSIFASGEEIETIFFDSLDDPEIASKIVQIYGDKLAIEELFDRIFPETDLSEIWNSEKGIEEKIQEAIEAIKEAV